MTAQAAWEKAIATYTGIDKQAQTVLHDLKALVIATFGNTSSRLADFGYKPRKVTVLTPEQKAAAAAKCAATRKARGTMGPKAKLKVTGTTAAANAAASAPTTPASNPQATTPRSLAPAAATAAPGAGGITERDRQREPSLGPPTEAVAAVRAREVGRAREGAEGPAEPARSRPEWRAPRGF